jgi:hypothetical protein
MPDTVVHAATGQRLICGVFVVFGVLFALAGLAAPKWPAGVLVGAVGLLFATLAGALVFAPIRSNAEAISYRRYFRKVIVSRDEIAAIEIRPALSMSAPQISVWLIRTGPRKPIMIRSLAVYDTRRGRARLAHVVDQFRNGQ